jgi:hypothetical protein
VNWILGVIIGVAVVFVVGWAGLKVRPAPFAPYGGPAGEPAADAPAELGTVPVPSDLPAPVARFYRELYGDALPRFDTVVLSGRATLRIMGVTLPARWRFVHDVGDAYRHEIVATWFGLPLLRVDERFVDGAGRMRLPFGTEQGPAVDQGANLALWAEAMWFPAALATDPRARWEPVDDVTALLRIPFGDERETLVARFDPRSGLLDTLEAMRFKGADASEKTLWITRAGAWGEVDGQPTATVARVRWLDEGRPWADFRVEELVANAPGARARLTAER